MGVKKLIEKYASEVPIEIRNAVKALSDDKKWAVYIALIEEGEKNFTSLKNLFGFHPEELSRILKSLKSGGLIRKYVTSLEDIGKPQRTYYAVTEFGRAFLESLCNLVECKHETRTTNEYNKVDLTCKPDYVVTLCSLDNLLLDIEEFDKTKEYLKKALESRKELAGKDLLDNEELSSSVLLYLLSSKTNEDLKYIFTDPLIFTFGAKYPLVKMQKKQERKSIKKRDTNKRLRDIQEK